MGLVRIERRNQCRPPKQILTELKKKGSEQTRKTYLRHGAPDNLFGVKVADMKVVAKKIKGDQYLAYELFDSGNVDAMYLAGMVADGSQMTKKQLDNWAKAASWYMVSEYAVPGVVSESPHARSLALKWMKAKKESTAACGWTTYSAMLSVTPDEELDLDEIKELLKHVTENIAAAKNRVRYTMNQFVISVGTYVQPLLKQANAAAKKIGKVDVNMGDTACKVPLATEYIAKVTKAGRVGKKRKTAKC